MYSFVSKSRESDPTTWLCWRNSTSEIYFHVPSGLSKTQLMEMLRCELETEDITDAFCQPFNHKNSIWTSQISPEITQNWILWITLIGKWQPLLETGRLENLGDYPEELEVHMYTIWSTVNVQICDVHVCKCRKH